MARSLNLDDPVYRAIIVKRRVKANPNYRGRGYDEIEKKYVELSPGEPRYIADDNDRYTEKLGPYEHASTAKAQVTRASTNWRGEVNQEFVTGSVQVGRIIWEDVIDG